MPNELICPECGGLIGGDPNVSSTYPCRCFDAAPEESVATENQSSAKVCCQCGKNVSGKKRFHDSLGYWCPACHREDKRKNKPQGERCADCGRIVPANALVAYAGLQICSRCREARGAAASHKRKYRAKVGDQAYRIHDRRRLMVMLGILAVLVTLIILSRAQIISGPF